MTALEEITPVARPSSSARSSNVGTAPLRDAAQSPRGTEASTDSTPDRVFTPVISALMVPAESGVCASVL